MGRMNALLSTVRKNRQTKRLIAALTSVALIVSGVSLLGYYYFGGLKINKLTDNINELGIEADLYDQYSQRGIKSIALLGIDSRGNNHVGRSDALMILSVDQEHNKIKLTSVARDTRVYYDEKRKYEKIGHAYAFGGALLSLRALNKNFRMNIKDYIAVNFAELVSLVDVMGGVNVQISEAERIATNELIISENMGEIIPHSGKVHLVGKQALEYSRIRKLDSDNNRTERQRKILRALFERLKTRKFIEYPEIIRQMIPMVETSLSYSDIVSLSGIMKHNPRLEEKAIPNETMNVKGGIFYEDRLWYFVYDLKVAAKQIHEFIYED